MKALMIALSMMGPGCLTPPDDKAPVHGDGGCDAARAQDLVGRGRSAELKAEAMRLTGARTMRWIEPDSVVTQDYREDRLNIHVDSDNKVIRFNCG
jgi:hypothetical protein